MTHIYFFQKSNLDIQSEMRNQVNPILSDLNFGQAIFCSKNLKPSLPQSANNKKRYKQLRRGVYKMIEYRPAYEPLSNNTIC